MTENPDLTGGPMGGFDLGAMLEQAQAMQAQLVAAQAELSAKTVDGAAGGVEVTLSGTGELVGVRISAGSFDGGDEESRGDPGGLVVGACREGRARAVAV